MPNASSVELAIALQPLKDQHGAVQRHEVLARPAGMTPEDLVALAPLEVLKAQLAFVRSVGLSGVLLNVEPATLNDLPEAQLCDLLLPASRMVTLEITERGVLESSALEVLTTFYNAGGEVWLDDFGTGHSTWEHRSELVQRGLVSGVKLPMGHDVSAARHLFLRDTCVVQEGVETAQQERQAFADGADLVQGWFAGPPVIQPYRAQLRLGAI